MNKFYRKNRDKKKYLNSNHEPRRITARSSCDISSKYEDPLDAAVRNIDGLSDLVGNGDFADYGVSKLMTMNMYD